MQVVNPYYARGSSVGAVFDVATWNPRRWYSPYWVAVIGLGLILTITAMALVFPQVLIVIPIDTLEEQLRELQKTIEAGQKEHPWWMLSGAAIAAALAYILLAVGVADLLLLDEQVYLRVGPGGMSLRVPNGLDMFRPWYKLLELEASWNDIADWRIVQHKQLGSLSPNSGNTYALLHLKLRCGTKHTIVLSQFREPARVIHSKIQDSVEMVPMDFEDAGFEDAGFEDAGFEDAGFEDAGYQDAGYQDAGYQDAGYQDAGVADAVQPFVAAPADVSLSKRDSHDAPVVALRRLLERDHGYAVFTHPESRKFVQFYNAEGSLCLDLPLQAVSEIETERALRLFSQWCRARPARLLSTPSGGGVATGQPGVNLGTDAEQAAQLMRETLRVVFQTQADVNLEVEEG